MLVDKLSVIFWSLIFYNFYLVKCTSIYKPLLPKKSTFAKNRELRREHIQAPARGTVEGSWGTTNKTHSHKDKRRLPD